MGEWAGQGSVTNDTQNGTSALAAAKDSSGQKGSWLCSVNVHVCT